MLPLFIQGVLLGGSAAAQPGPFQAYLLSLVLRNGWARSLSAAFAPLISDGPIIILVLFILTRLPDWGLHALRIAGGIFLLYLAWGAFRTFQAGQTAELPPKPEPRGVLKAALMNALSPGPYIYWSTITGPILIDAWNQAPGNAVAFLVGFYGALVGGCMLLITLFAAAGKLDARLSRGLALFSAVAMFAFGIYQLLTGFRQFGLLP